MTQDTPSHLSLADLDDWLAGNLTPGRREHLEACASCQQLAEAEHGLVELLSSLPHLDPAPGFADRVMAAVEIPDPFALRAVATWWQRLTSDRHRLAVAAGVMLLLLTGMGGSVAWSLANPDVVPGIGSWLSGEAAQWFWLTLRGLGSNLLEQPWYTAVRDAAGSPARLAFVAGGASVLYVTGMLAMRRLLSLPSAEVAHARP